jgi:eukaryotic-like serine/threonine-protein kinase
VIDREERLALALDELSRQHSAGKQPELTRLATEQPDIATEMRELWAVSQLAQLARSHSGPAPAPVEAPSTTESFPRSFGDFTLQAELGRGGMGVVYKARQASLNRTVAVKFVREANLSSEADRARFRHEAESAARLHHPNIVTMHNVGTLNGQAYLCMEYIDGVTLAEKLKSGGPLPSREAAKLVAAIARGVQHAHEQGVLHRDLKPSNILLPRAAELEPKITDFGLAKQLDRDESLTRTGLIVGTPSYMAPEQATSRKDVTASADIYSLGAILYELLTGRPPFQASNAMDTLLLVLEQEPVPPRDFNPTVDRDLELICLKCLQKPPELRYSTAAGLSKDLEAYLINEPLSVQGSFGSFVSRLLRETHHAAVLENWGLLWMWHSAVILVLCVATQMMGWANVESHVGYLVLWGAGLLTWGTIFWRLRRRGGPVLFVERQIAHAWAAGTSSSIGLFIIEVVQDLPPLKLSPVLPVLAGMVFFFKAGTLSGQFYIAVLLYFATAVYMALFPQSGHIVFGIVSALTFLVPGYKYYRQRKKRVQSPF